MARSINLSIDQAEPGLRAGPEQIWAWRCSRVNKYSLTWPAENLGEHSLSLSQSRRNSRCTASARMLTSSRGESWLIKLKLALRTRIKMKLMARERLRSLSAEIKQPSSGTTSFPNQRRADDFLIRPRHATKQYSSSRRPGREVQARLSKLERRSRAFACRPYF